MSGGFFNHSQYNLDQISADIEDEIYYNDSEEVNEYNDKRGNGFSEETIQEFKLAVWYLKQAQATLKVATVTTVSQKDLGKLLSENKNKADYIICVAEDMTTTY